MTTLVSYRRDAALRGGRYAQVTAKSSGNSTTTIRVDALVSSISMDDAFTQAWVYLPAASAADKVRRVSLYTPASTGTLTVDRAFSGSTVPDSKAVEIHGLCLPFSDDITAFSWTSAINEALKKIWISTEFTITPTASAIRHSLASQAWLLGRDQILKVGWLLSGETRANQDPYETRRVKGDVEQDGATLYLHHPRRTFASNETIYVQALKRAYDHCKASAGAYGDQSGLALETDEAPVPVELVRWAALVEVAENRQNDVGQEGRSHVATRQQTWADRWRVARDTYQGSLPRRTFHNRQSFYVNTRLG